MGREVAHLVLEVVLVRVRGARELKPLVSESKRGDDAGSPRSLMIALDRAG